jgi:hydroxymethylglutaryl-CoA lyase
MQGHIPAESKAEYIRALMEAGFRHLDAVAFVSPAAVPQMADAEQVLRLLQPAAGAEILAIVVNGQGVERAIATGRVTTLGFPFSLSPTFLARNQKQTVAQARDVLKEVAKKAAEAGLDVVAYLSMAFGNPYGDPWSEQEVVTAAREIAGLGIRQISLADTVGVASAPQVNAVLSAVISQVPDVEVGAHLHASRAQSREKILAAYEAGCRRFDSAIGGQGGCPFAQDALVGNLATETVLEVLGERGAALPRLGELSQLLARARAIGERFGTTGAH